MANQKVDTDKIISSANRLHTVNNNINNAFNAMQDKARLLDYNWNGEAGDAARSMRNQIFRNNDARSSVLQNYVSMLEQQINPGYTDAENVNTRLSDNFK